MDKKLDISDLKASLRQIWGYSDFRYPQEEIIRALLNRKDALIVMPTGGGKSICFQLPALLQEGLTLVISPLIALMENQVKQLQQHNLPVALIHSQQSRGDRSAPLRDRVAPLCDRQQILSAIAQGRLRLLYLSPETLLSIPVWEKISQPDVTINGIILDEAHCLVQWGTTFRPAYTRLGALRATLLKNKLQSRISIAAFTATADYDTQTAIINTLQLQQPAKFLLSPYRSNLHLQIKTVWTPRGRKQETLKFIQDKPQQSGLIYVRSRKDSEELATWLQTKQLNTLPYHAGLTDIQRRNIETQWIEGKIPFVICTSAFGMGIDKSDCRWIIHYHTPELLAEYMQEIGRSGRDGKPAKTLALVSEPTGWLNPEDKQRNQFFSRHLQQQSLQAQQLIKSLPSQGTIETVVKSNPEAGIALAILHSLGRISWSDPFHYRRQSSTISIKSWQKKQQFWQHQMQQFLHTKQCRWQFLLTAFGFSQEAAGFHCGNCDRCKKNDY